MSWRNVLLQNKARLNLENAQLLITCAGDSASLPLEDIGVLILDHPQIMITTALLAELQQVGVVVMVCDKKHHPAGLLHPFHQHSRMSDVAEIQRIWSQPFRKRCWQALVRQKITNQAHCLDRSGLGPSHKVVKNLRNLVRKVDSGDSQNCEAQAARLYWQALMGSDFFRVTNGGTSPRKNAALNFGYAIIRATIARSIVAHGLLPCFGLFHHSKLNAFNLADDLIEPFRPLADGLVRRMSELWDDNMANRAEQKSAFDGLCREDRQQLAGLGGEQVLIDSEVQSLGNATDILVQSLVRASRDKDASCLKLPGFAL